MSRYDVLLKHRDRLSILYIVGRMLIPCQGQSVVSFACYMQHDIIIFFFHLCTVHFEFYVVHTPTNPLFINLVESFNLH